MADETENQLPVGEVISSQPAPLTTVRQFTDDKKADTLVAINGALPKKINGPVQLPQLQESAQTGYTKGDPSQIVCCTVGKFLIEKNTAYDYIMMATAAAKDGITLKIKSGFRTMEEQRRLSIERSNPAVAEKLGVAAKPGHSNHQSGQAIDIDVKMTKAMYRANQRTAEYKWLETFGEEFGFDHVEGHKVSEPWHWTHLKKEIRGSQAFLSATGFEVLTAETALAAANLNQSGTKRTANQEMHDKTVGFSRSATLPNSSRATLYTAHAEFCANSSNGLGHDVSQGEVATLETEPAAFRTETLGAFSYDFATGTWGDGKTV